jgi:hypothetical protein
MGTRPSLTRRRISGHPSRYEPLGLALLLPGAWRLVPALELREDPRHSPVRANALIVAEEAKLR